MSKIALITGASTGIGKEFAREFAKDKMDVILVARSNDLLEENARELEATYKIKAYVYAIDLSAPNSANRLYEKTKADGLEVEYLVNNAGFGDHGYFAQSKLSKQEEMINLNILTLTKLTHLYVQDMKTRKSGTILNLASTASFQPGPLMSVYFATKHFVLAFSEAIAEELKQYNIKVCALCPGPTESGFPKLAGMSNNSFLEPSKNKIPTSTEVAKFGYQKMKKGKVVSIHGFLNAFMANLVRFAPRSLVRKATYAMMKKG
jgi:short-subunit dehydrogenase